VGPDVDGDGTPARLIGAPGNTVEVWQVGLVNPVFGRASLHPGRSASWIPSVPARNLPVGQISHLAVQPACKNILLLRRPKSLTSMSFNGRPPNRGAPKGSGKVVDDVPSRGLGSLA
jgi:hypothetical protein